MNVTSVWFGCSSTPQPLFGFGKLSRNRYTKPHSPLKLHACLVNFPLASKILVRNLSHSTTESCLRDEFSTYGQLAEVKLAVDEATKRSKGYAFIQYTCQDDAVVALESMDHKYLDGRLVFVELAKPGHNAFGGYPKIFGASPQEEIPREKIPVLSKRKKKKKKIHLTKQGEEPSE